MFDDRTTRRVATLSGLCSMFAFALVTPTAAQVTFDPAVPIVSAANSNEVVVVADVDGDGQPDVVAGASAPTGQRWYRNLGGFSFSAGTPLPVIGDYDDTRAGTSGDVDGDGDEDLVLAQTDYHPDLGVSYRIVLFRNDGGGGFTATTLAGPDLPSDVLLVDLDDDGDRDLLQSDDNGVFWAPNDGTGSFSPGNLITNSLVRPRCARAADLNGDSRPDVLACSYDDQVVWIPNNGGGSFGLPQAITTEHLNPYSLAGADIDGDGDEDVLVGSLHESTPAGEPQIDGIVAWYENLDAAGGFGPQQVLLSEFPGGTFDVHLVDLDADGRNDALWPEFDQLSWSRNTGGGAFAPIAGVALSGIGGREAAVADLDGDHRLDAAVAVRNADLVDGFRQQPNPAATSFCDGPQLPCPCGNPAGNREGCANSTGAGAYLEWAGSASLAADDLVLRAFQAPPRKPGLLAQGSTMIQTPLSDGLRCIGGTVRRLKIVFADANGTVDISEHLGSLSAGVMAGSTSFYQMWYRDPAPGQCGTGSNLSSAIAVTWQ